MDSRLVTINLMPAMSGDVLTLASTPNSRMIKPLPQGSNQHLGRTRVHGRELRNVACGLPILHRRRNQVDNFRGSRPDSYASENVGVFRVKQAFYCHLLTLNRTEIVVCQ